MLQAIGFINAAFILYTVGVWSEKIQGKLTAGHLFIFWLGIICDTLGTMAMGEMAKQNINGKIQNWVDYLPAHMDFHSLSGSFALALMFMHACWATYVIFNKKTSLIKNFHKYSVAVWLLWLVPFITGAIYHFR